MGPPRGRGSKDKAVAQVPVQEENDDGLPKGEERRALTTLQALTVTIGMCLEVLRGRVSRDRPLLAAKACRLMSMLSKHHLELLEQVESASNVQVNELGIRLRPTSLPENDLRPEAPFAKLQTS